MKFLRPIIIGLIPLLHTAVFLLLPLMEHYILWIIPAVFLATDLLLLPLTPPRASWTTRLSTTLPSLLLIVSSLGLYLFLEDNALPARIAVIVVNALIQAIYLFNLYTYSYWKKWYQERSLSHTSGYMNMLTVFCASSFMFASVFFLDIPIWYLMAPFLLIIIGLSSQTLWIENISIRSQIHLWAAMPLIMIELLYALLWLPVFYYVNGLIITVWYTLLIYLGLSSARKELEKREVTGIIIIGLIVIVLLVLTARSR